MMGKSGKGIRALLAILSYPWSGWCFQTGNGNQKQEDFTENYPSSEPFGQND